MSKSNVVAFSPEYGHVMMGMRGTQMFREDTKEILLGITFGQTKQLEGLTVLTEKWTPSKIEKAAWASKLHAPIIEDGCRIMAGTVMTQKTDQGGRRHYIVGPKENDTGVIVKVQTGLWGGRVEVEKLLAQTPGGVMLPHGVFDVSRDGLAEHLFGGDFEEEINPAYQALFSNGGKPVEVPSAGGPILVHPKRASLWQTHDGSRLLVGGCTSDSLYLLSNRNGQIVKEHDTSGKWRDVFDQMMMERANKNALRRASAAQANA